MALNKYFKILLWLLLVVGCSLLVVYKTEFSTDISVFLPNTTDHSNSALLELNKSQQQQSASLLMIAIKMDEVNPSAVKALANTSRVLRQKLQATQLFNFILNGENRQSSALVTELFDHRYLLDSGISIDTFTPQNMQTQFKLRLQELTSPAAHIIKSTLTADPLANGRRVLRAWQQGNQLAKSYGVWFTQDKTAALLLADIKLSGYDVTLQEAAINQVKQVFTELHLKDVGLNISGPGVFAVASKTAIVSDSKRLSILGTLAILLIFLLAYRSAWLIFLGSLPIVTAVITAIAVTDLIFSSVHGITIAFGVTLLGIATDYPVHLFSHLQRNSTSALDRSRIIHDIWPTMRLGMLTTCIGFAAMLHTAFSGLSQLAVFAISGLLTAALVTRYVLPAILQTSYIARARLIDDAQAEILSQPVTRPVKFTVFSGALVLIALFLTSVHWEDDLTAISPLSESAKKNDQQMRQQLAIPDLNHIAYISGDSVETVLIKSEALQTAIDSLITQNVIQNYQAAFRYLPSVKQQRINQALLPDKVDLQNNMAKALKATSFKPESFKPFIQAVVEAKNQAPITYARLRGTPVALPLKNLLIESSPGNWYGFIRFSGVSNPQALKKWASTQPDIHYINIKQSTSEMVFSFRDEALQRMMWGSVILALVLTIALGNIRRTARILLTLMLSVCFVIISLNILGMALSLFHIISLLLVVGLGLDYSLFFSRNEPNRQSQINTLQGLLICFCSTFAVFAILSLSNLPVLQSIGITVMLGVLYSFIFAWLFSAQVCTQYKSEIM